MKESKWIPKIQGVFVATVTPFNETGEVCLPTFEKHLQSLADAGVQGFVPCGTTGEAATLKAFEREDLIRSAVNMARNTGLKVIAGCGSNSTQVALELLEEAHELGADFGLVVTPYYNKPTQSGLLAHYGYLAEHSPLPILLYNVPGRTSVSLSVETVRTLMEHPNVVGMKEASGQYSYWSQLSEAADWSQKALLAGDDDAFAVISMLGGSGIISASANVVPRHFIALQKAIENRDWSLAFQIQKTINPLVRVLFSETNPSPVKAALSLMGRMAEAVRMPLVGISPDTLTLLKSTLHQLEVLS